METPTTLPRQWLLRALDLETDRGHGPVHLSQTGLRAFREALEETAGDGPGVRRAKLDAYAARLRRARPDVISLAIRLRRCLAALDDGLDAAREETDRVLSE